jgi:hypothetical protein
MPDEPMKLSSAEFEDAAIYEGAKPLSVKQKIADQP